MAINKQLMTMYKISEYDYKEWCKENKKPVYKESTKREFFARLEDGRIQRDSLTGKLIKKRKNSD